MTKGFMSSVKHSNNLPEESRACLLALKKLVALAEQGQLRGLAYAITYTEGDDSAYSAWDVEAVGSYRTYPMDAVATVSMLRLTVERWVLDGVDESPPHR